MGSFHVLPLDLKLKNMNVSVKPDDRGAMLASALAWREKVG